jgi:hypothetical protein
MPEHDSNTDALPPAGPFFTNWGPLDGPIGREIPGAIGILARVEHAPTELGMPIGIAYPVGLVEHRKGPIKTFRLVVGKVERPGRWICVARRFIQLGDAAEEL